MKELQKIELLQYPKNMQLTKGRRAVYYKKENLPKKYQKLVNDGIYTFNKKGLLVDEKKKRVIKNKASLNKPRLLVFSGNDLISGYSTPHTRNKMSNYLKNEFFIPAIKKSNLKPFNSFDYPLIVNSEIHTTVNSFPLWDLSNLFFYYKYFEDSLKDCGIIPDDNFLYITKPGNGFELFPVEEEKHRKFVFTFYKDEKLEKEPINKLRKEHESK